MLHADLKELTDLASSTENTDDITHDLANSYFDHQDTDPQSYASEYVSGDACESVYTSIATGKNLVAKQLVILRGWEEDGHTANIWCGASMDVYLIIMLQIRVEKASNYRCRWS